MTVKLKSWGFSIPSQYTPPEHRAYCLIGLPEGHPKEEFADTDRQIRTSILRDPSMDSGRHFHSRNTEYELEGPPSVEWLKQLAAAGYDIVKLDFDNPFRIFGGYNG